MPNSYNTLFKDEYFESIYKHGNILNVEQFELASESFARDYEEIIPEDKNAAFLDVGCGVGHFLYHLKKMGYRNYYGIDISRQQIEYCTKNVTEQVEVADAFIFLQNMENRYDVICLHDVLEHIAKENIITLLKLLFQALKKEGMVILRVPNMSTPFGLDARYNDFTHEIGYTAKSLYQVLWVCGFREIRILPPKQIIIKNYRNIIRKFMVMILHQLIRFCYYIQDYNVPQNLDKNLTIIGKKI